MSGREYFIDSSANQLLFIPPNGEDLSQPAADGLGVFLSKEEHAHSMDGASSIVLQVHFLCSVLVSECPLSASLSQRSQPLVAAVRQGLRLEYAMGAALSATNVTDVQIANCTISTSGTDGIIIDGRDSTVSVSRDDQTQLSLSDSDQPASLSFRIHRL